ncbi:MAG: hypothetical protein IJN86_02395 [Clostridia bacterium]|nr:hypothetical protein [Clostridia bacterium]
MKTQIAIHTMLGVLFFVLLVLYKQDLKSLFCYLNSVSYWYGVCIIVAFFAISAAFSFPPLTTVYIMCGMTLTAYAALALAFYGSVMFFTFSYYWGKWKGGDASMVLGLSGGGKNGFLTAFVLRGMRIIPCRMAGIYMGKANLPFLGYLLGSILGSVPSIVLALLFGKTLK